MHNPFTLSGKTILVTGASSGIGRVIAIECSKMNAQLIILGRNQERLKNTFDHLQPNENHKMFSLDLTSKENLDDFIKSIATIDGLVNVAGILKRLPFKFIDSDALEEVMKINFFAPAILTKELVSKRKLNNGSSVVFISSISGSFISSIGNSIYSSSKGAIDALSRNIALELAPKKIRVNTINPGMVDTDLLSEKSFTEEELKKDIENYPLKRYGKPEDIAHAVIYLLSDASSWVTGSNLLIDGGFTLK